MIQYSHGCKLNKVQVAGALLGLADAIETLKGPSSRIITAVRRLLDAWCLVLDNQLALQSTNQLTLVFALSLHSSFSFSKSHHSNHTCFTSHRTRTYTATTRSSPSTPATMFIARSEYGSYHDQPLPCQLANMFLQIAVSSASLLSLLHPRKTILIPL
jgi:hypothetical protein